MTPRLTQTPPSDQLGASRRSRLALTFRGDKADIRVCEPKISGYCEHDMLEHIGDCVPVNTLARSSGLSFQQDGPTKGQNTMRINAKKTHRIRFS